MNDPQPLVQFPVPSTFTLYVLAFIAIGLIGLAVSADIYRRSKIRQARLRQQWRAVHDILRDRNITGDEAARLEHMLKRHTAREPLKAVTTREGFGELIQREMRVRAKDDPHNFEQLGIRLRAIRTELGLDYVPAGQSLYSTRELHDGQWMSIAPLDDGQQPRWTRVMIQHVNEAFFYVDMRDSPASTAPNFEPGQPIRCRLWREEDARYLFETTVAAYDAPPPTWRLHHTDELSRTQNRAHFRVRHNQAVVAGVLNAPRDKDNTDLKNRAVVTRIPGRITSLSAGGCAIVFKQAVARHVLLRVPLEIAGKQPLDVELEIVATASISGGRYLVRGKFLGLSDETHDRIARYVHYKQQQRLTKQHANR